ncbi:disease resistance protein RPM1-like [Hevea brasiliensis]|uniref:disease resistance protein RPM1-like n=1 Tax=Hevea brasiliensis TaxID=3981 RepID=UPI0025E669F9|nr:disease resistance protein RPM1-like [Hevea brasiliensis]
METELFDRAVRVPKGIEKLVNLRTCTGVYAVRGIFSELGSLTQLRKLGVTCVSEDHASEIFVAIIKMENLISLSLRSEAGACDGTLFPDMEQFSPPPLLQELHLDGRLFEMPEWLATMENLTTLFLSKSYPFENPTSVFQFLPKLKYLTLWEAYQLELIGKEFCKVGGFPELQSLTIAAKYLVEYTEIVNGDFSVLMIGPC